MLTPTPDSPQKPSLSEREDRLDSWKQIAAYLDRGVTTVQRWEADEALPVHRLAHAKRGSVFAFKSELDTWKSRRTRLPGGLGETRNETERPPTGRNRRLMVTAGVAVVVAAVLSATRFGRAASDLTEVSAGPVPVTSDEAREEAPSFSPDGRSIVYHWVKADSPGLYIRSPDGGPPRRLNVGRLSSPGFPKWSPDGQHIAFLNLEPNGLRNVYVVPAGGHDAPRLLATAHGIGLCWTADAKTLGYIDRGAASEPVSVFSVDVATGARRQLTIAPASSFGDTHCSFSRSGRLAVSRHFTRFQSDVVVFDPDGSHRRLTNASEGITGLAWTPNDREIVFGTSSGLWRVRAEGANPAPRQLLRTEAALLYPSFASSGAAAPRLAFESRSIDVNLWSWTEESDRRNAFRKVAGSTVWDDHPDLSPDGSRIVFVSSRSGFPEIWMAGADGRESLQITDNRGAPSLTPRWSPDGKRIVYTSMIDGQHDIFIAGPDGSSLRLTREGSQEEYPSWSRDGQWIYFKSDRGGLSQIWRTRSNGSGSARLITHGEGSQAFESRDGTAVYFVRSLRDPGLWVVPVGGGPETRIAPDVLEGLWALADTAVVFVVKSPAPALRIFGLRSREVRSLANLPARAGLIGAGLAVSRDARRVLWAKIDRWDSNVMMIDAWTR